MCMIWMDWCKEVDQGSRCKIAGITNLPTVNIVQKKYTYKKDFDPAPIHTLVVSPT